MAGSAREAGGQSCRLSSVGLICIRVQGSTKKLQTSQASAFYTAFMPVKIYGKVPAVRCGRPFFSYFIRQTNEQGKKKQDDDGDDDESRRGKLSDIKIRSSKSVFIDY